MTSLTDDVAADFHSVESGGLEEAEGDEGVDFANETLSEGREELDGSRQHDDTSSPEPESKPTHSQTRDV